MASMQRDSKILFFFPLVLIGVIISIDIVRGPDWFINYSENAYIILVQGLRTFYNNSLILKAVAIPLTAIVCPFIIWIISSIRGVDNVTYDLLYNPEIYLGVMRYLFIFFVFFSIVISGRLAWRYTGFLWIALFFQAMPFCFSIYGYLLGLTLTVDLIHLGVGLLLGAILIPFALTNENISKGYVRVLYVSALCGFGTACKITFFPATITAFLLVPTLRNKGFFLLVFSIVFWGLQLPFVSLHDLLQSWVPVNTVFSQENKDFVNYFNMLWLNFTNMVSNHSRFYFLYLHFYVLAAFLFRFLLAFLAKTFSFEKLRVALILNTGLISAIIFISLRPKDWYFIPMGGILGIALCEAVIGLSTDINKFFHFSFRSCQKALVLLTALFLVVLISYKALISDIVVFDAISNNRIISYQKLELLEKDYSQAGVILVYRGNHPYSALFHSLLSYGGGIGKDQLQRIIPDRFYHMFDYDFISFYNSKGEKFNFKELRARHKQLLFLGSADLLEKKLPRFFNLAPIPGIVDKQWSTGMQKGTILAVAEFFDYRSFSAKASRENPATPIDNLFSRSNAYWEVNIDTPVSIIFSSLEQNPIEISRYAITASYWDWQRSPVKFKFAGSNDGSKWTVLDEQDGITSWKQTETKYFKIKTPGKFSMYKFIFYKAGTENILRMQNIEFFGTHSEPIRL